MTDQQQLYTLQGEYNRLVSTRRWLKTEGKALLAQIDEIENRIQRQNQLNDEQAARLNAQGGCATGEC